MARCLSAVFALLGAASAVVPAAAGSKLTATQQSADHQAAKRLSAQADFSTHRNDLLDCSLRLSYMLAAASDDSLEIVEERFASHLKTLREFENESLFVVPDEQVSALRRIVDAKGRGYHNFRTASARGNDDRDVHRHFNSPRELTSATPSPTAPTATTTRFVRFNMTEVRGGSGESVQLSELVLFDQYGDEIDLSAAVITNPGGYNGAWGSGEEPEYAIDGDLNTKWYDLNGGNLVIRFGLVSARNVASYDWATANDAPERDPIRFSLDQKFDVDSIWSVLDDTFATTGFSTTTDRLTWQGPFQCSLWNPTSAPTLTPVPSVTLAPSPNPTTPAPTTLMFEVESGACTAVGSCFYSPGFPNDYGNYETCAISVLASGTLIVDESFTNCSSGCVDTDNGAADPYGDGCLEYTVTPSWCGNYDDTDFSSDEMCCICQGTSSCGCDDLSIGDGNQFCGMSESDGIFVTSKSAITFSSGGTGTGFEICIGDSPSSVPTLTLVPSISPAPSPSPTREPTPAPTSSMMFEIESGACTAVGACFYSPGFPNDYGSSESCIISALTDGILSVESFDLEYHATCSYDDLSIDGNQFCGTTGPGGVSVTNESTITFSSDSSSVGSGFKICFATPSPTPAPTATPVPSITPAPTSSPTSPFFEIESGECTAVGACFYSPGFPNNYGYYETCAISPLVDGILAVGSFELYDSYNCYYDSLSIDEVQFCGTSGPDGVYVTSESNITFSSNSYSAGSGFEICLTPSPTPAPTATPVPSITPAPSPNPTSPFFEIESGACTAVGACFHSPGFPNDYGNYEFCAISPLVDGILAVESFELDEDYGSCSSSYDHLTVDGVQFCRTTGPDGVYVTSESTVTFSSNYYTTGSGFKICVVSTPLSWKNMISTFLEWIWKRD
jgi:hypothetical protein